MNHGRFEQLGTPQELYYSPATAFVAGFVGANNRLPGKVLGTSGALVEVAVADGWRVRARAHGAVGSGAAAAVFLRPEAATLARVAGDLPPEHTVHAGEIMSLLFDGANSVALLRESHSRLELRIALPQTGALADLKVGERVYFGFDPQRAVCFASPSHG
jgi:spermidine/putrescine transport system ATP-binding protein